MTSKKNATINGLLIATILVTTFLNVTLSLISIYVTNVYGFALFVSIPFINGIVNGFWLTKKLYESESSQIYLNIFGSVVLSTLFSGILLLFGGIEGLICILMALPIFIIISLVTACITLIVCRKYIHKTQNAIWIFALFTFPITSYLDTILAPTLHEVKTEIIISAPIDKVWENVVVFSPMKEPTEWIFKSGISYPLHATIEGEGVGAIRYCTFNTGSFVEPITIWNEPYLLAFDVEEQPIPLKEVSFWDIDAPHLHDFFVSKNGQFELEKIDLNTTKLTGTTLYYHKIQPAFYWKWWSNSIIHTIHNRVLQHIKESAETDSLILN